METILFFFAMGLQDAAGCGGGGGRWRGADERTKREFSCWLRRVERFKSFLFDLSNLYNFDMGANGVCGES